MPKYWVSRAPRDGSVLARNGASFLPPAPNVNPNDSFSSRITQTCLMRGGLNACGAADRAGAVRAAAGMAAVAPAPAASMITAAATGSLRRRALCTVAPRGVRAHDLVVLSVDSTDRTARSRELEARVDRVGFKGQYAEHALVHPVQRLPGGEPVQGLDPQRVLAQRQRPLAVQAAVAQPAQVGLQQVLGPVDQPQVLRAAALHARLDPAGLAAGPLRLGGLDHHALAARAGQLLPPGGDPLLVPSRARSVQDGADVP